MIVQATQRVQKPSVKVILTLFRRLILAMAVGIVIFGSSLLTPYLLTNERLSTGLAKTNSTSNFNASSGYLSPPTLGAASNASVGFIETRTDEYLLILRQNSKNLDKSIHPLVVDLTKNRSSSVINQEWFESDLSISKSCSLVHKGLLYVYGGLADKRQILNLDWCGNKNPDQSEKTKLKRVGQLQFDFTGGTCVTNGAVFVLCFGSIGSRTCYRSDTPITTSDWWSTSGGRGSSQLLIRITIIDYRL